MTGMMYLIALTVAAAVGLLVWMFWARWRLAGRSASARLATAYTVEHLDYLESLPRNSWEYKLAAAGLNLTPARFHLLSLGLAVAALALAWRFAPGVPALVAAALAFYAPRAYVEQRLQRRGREIDKRLPLALSRIAAGVQAGHGLVQVLERVADSLDEEGPNPLAPELRKTARDMRAKGVETALRDLAKRSPSPALSNVAMLMLSYHRAGGGQYADVFVTVSQSLQRVLTVRNSARAKAATALQTAKTLPLMLLAALLLLGTDPALKEAFFSPFMQVLVALVVLWMAFGYTVIQRQIEGVV